MFGILVPELNAVSPASQQSYNISYCNLCAALSAIGTGVLNRLFLVNDVVTIDWLLTDDEQTNQHTFSCRNCVKGGVIGKKARIH